MRPGSSARRRERKKQPASARAACAALEVARATCVLAALATSGCGDDAGGARGTEWNEPSHGNVPPDLATAFPADRVRALTLRVAQADWDALAAQMAQYCGDFGAGQRGCTGSTNQLDMVPDDAQRWIPATLETDGEVWKHVGLRLKGNSSLTQAWSQGSYALPFRLTMDKLEDDEPSIADQRFYGFQKLSLSNNSGDDSDIRELVARDYFREYEVPVSSSSLARVTLVIGDTARSTSMYTLVEVPDEPLLERWFEDDDGNLYKPLSNLAAFAEADFADDGITDMSDVQAFIDALNDDLRTADSATWRANLEARFDVRLFLRYLAINTLIMNWDAYGQMAHNYYLYNHDGVLRWMAWDLGLSLGSSLGGGAPPGGGGPPPGGGGPPPGGGGGPGGGMSSTSIWYENAGASWPLITNLLADPVYCRAYASVMDEAMRTVVTEGSFATKTATYGALVTPLGSTPLTYDLAARLATVRTSLAETNTRCPPQ